MIFMPSALNKQGPKPQVLNCLEIIDIVHVVEIRKARKVFRNNLPKHSLHLILLRLAEN